MRFCVIIKEFFLLDLILDEVRIIEKTKIKKLFVDYFDNPTNIKFKNIAQYLFGLNYQEDSLLDLHCFLNELRNYNPVLFTKELKEGRKIFEDSRIKKISANNLEVFTGYNFPEEIIFEPISLN